MQLEVSHVQHYKERQGQVLSQDRWGKLDGQEGGGDRVCHMIDGAYKFFWKLDYFVARFDDSSFISDKNFLCSISRTNFDVPALIRRQISSNVIIFIVGQIHLIDTLHPLIRRRRRRVGAITAFGRVATIVAASTRPVPIPISGYEWVEGDDFLVLATTSSFSWANRRSTRTTSPSARETTAIGEPLFL